VNALTREDVPRLKKRLPKHWQEISGASAAWRVPPNSTRGRFEHCAPRWSLKLLAIRLGQSPDNSASRSTTLPSWPRRSISRGTE
jgi:hypothetical protein